VLQAATWAAYGFVESAFEECWDRAVEDRSSHIVITETSGSAILSLGDIPAESLNRLDWLIRKIVDLTEWGFERMKLVLGPELGPRILATFSRPILSEYHWISRSITLANGNGTSTSSLS
jgi:hypothetical protein